MTDDYEDRRRALDAQYVSALELLREWYHLKLAALDGLRSSPAQVAAPPVAVQPPSAPEPSRTNPPARPAPLPRRAEPKAPIDVQLALMHALPDMPESFDNSQIVRALGYKPTRATLARAIAPLLDQGYIVVEEEARGRRSNV